MTITDSNGPIQSTWQTLQDGRLQDGCRTDLEFVCRISNPISHTSPFRLVLFALLLLFLPLPLQLAFELDCFVE